MSEKTHQKATRQIKPTETPPNPQYTPSMGGGKLRSELYQTRLCLTAQEIDDFLNKDAYAFSYKYMNPQAVGVMITLCKPNPLAHEQKYTKQIQRGLLELSENDATQKTRDLFSHTDLVAIPTDSLGIEINFLVARLYDNGFRLCKQVDEVKPQ
jgi:hypothetical protein